jgi:predicted N-acetyltransferase YhbS
MLIELSQEEKKQLTDLSEYGYIFDWTAKSSLKSLTVVNSINGDIAGLVEFERQPENLCNYMWLVEVAKNYKGTGIAGQLLAYVGRDSLNFGFEGFVVFETKTALFRYYQRKYGAKPIGARKLYFDTDATKKLIDKYLKGN